MSPLRLATLAAAGAALIAVSAAVADGGAREAAGAFGNALLARRAAGLRAVLPSTGKVQLSLVRLGPEQGMFGPPQVEEVFRDFLSRGSVKSFEVLQVASEPAHAVVRARLVLVDADGRPARAGLHQSLQAEDGLWVVREIKETGE